MSSRAKRKTLRRPAVSSEDKRAMDRAEEQKRMRDQDTTDMTRPLTTPVADGSKVTS